MTNLELRLLAATLDLKSIRKACGISSTRVARALGVPTAIISKFESGTIAPSGPRGAAYMRIVAAMRNHLEAEAGEQCREEAA